MIDRERLEDKKDLIQFINSLKKLKWKLSYAKSIFILFY